MKVQDIISEEELQERALRGVLAAGIVGAGMFKGMNKPSEIPPEKPISFQQIEEPVNPEIKEKEKIYNYVVSQYSLNNEKAEHIVDLAYKYAKNDFPKAKDILAIIGIESEYNPNAVSQLANDPAVGLMQIRPNVWDLNKKMLFNTEDNIKHGSEILNLYFKKLKNSEDAIQAYNIGITNFNNGMNATRYLNKYNREKKRIETSARNYSKSL